MPVLFGGRVADLVIRLFLKSLAASLRSARSLSLLTVIGVALGVASVLAIQIINRSALSAFEGSMQAVSGDADLTILGRTPAIPDSLLPTVLGQAGVRSAWPLVRIPVALADTSGTMGRLETEFLDVVGVDFFTSVRIPWEGRPGDLSASLREPGWAAFSPVLAAQHGWDIGDSVTVWAGSRRVGLHVGALVDFTELSPLASPRLVVTDISQAQALLGRAGWIQQIDVVLSNGADVDAVTDSLRARLGSAVRVVTPEERSDQARGLLSAFRLNLTAMSMISLFVGLFLIYSATQASLVRRRREFGTLRSIGAGRGQVLGLILSEVAIVGMLGVSLGLPLGYAVARANIDVVSIALTNLYLIEEISAVDTPPGLFLIAGITGVVGSLLGALIPALDMSRRDPRQLLSSLTLHQRIDSLAPRLGWLAMAALVAAGGWFAVGGHRWQHAGFVLAVALLAALPLLTPITIRWLTRPLQNTGFGVVYSMRSLGSRLQSSAFAVASLGVAVSMLVGISIMVDSFRDTLQVWIETTVQADIYVSPAAWRGPGQEAFLDEDLANALAGHTSVRAVDRLRAFAAYTEADDRVMVAGVDVGLPDVSRRFTLLAGDATQAFDRVHAAGQILAGETLARRFDLWVGDELRLHTSKGVQVFTIAGVYYDYDARGGGVLMDLRTLREHWGHDGLNGIALYLHAGQDADEVVDQLRSAPGVEALEMISNRRLRAEAIEIFDQTFAVTRLLQVISLAIAVCGVSLMLLVMAREQVSEVALYRAIGATRRQVFGLFVGKGLGMGGLGIVLGGVGGVLLALVLIFVINRAYFGWTIQWHWPWWTFVEQAAMILLATVASSLYPAWRASLTPATELRKEDM